MIDYDCEEEREEKSEKKKVNKKKSQNKRTGRNRNIRGVKNELRTGRKYLKIAEEAAGLFEEKKNRVINKSTLLLRALQLFNALKISIVGS